MRLAGESWRSVPAERLTAGHINLYLPPMIPGLITSSKSSLPFESS